MARSNATWTAVFNFWSARATAPAVFAAIR